MIAPDHTNTRMRCPTLRQVRWLYLSIVLIFGIALTTYLTETGREVLDTVRLNLPSFRPGDNEQGGRPPPGGFYDEEKPHEVQTGQNFGVTVPPGVRVIGLVFYGRRELVKVLDCYLKRNLKENGGLLDEVIFAVRTEIPEDLEYLEILLQSHPHYRKHVETQSYDWYIGSWEAVNETNSIYIKIDDDTVYLEDQTIPAVVKRLLENPQYFAVSANVVNSPALSWVHVQLGVYEPYFPEMTAPEHPPPPSWRASELPTYKGPPEGPEGFTIDGESLPPYEGHRWLPVRPPSGSTFDMAHTPASTITYDAFGPGSLRSWATAAQTHYSFLQHLEQGDTWRYKFDTWDFQYQRLSINFLAVRGKDIMDAFPFPQPDDEAYLTEVRPSQMNRHVVVDGTALAVHYAFNPQYMAHGRKGLTWTDVLPRYAAYAKEMVCPGGPW